MEQAHPQMSVEDHLRMLDALKPGETYIYFKGSLAEERRKHARDSRKRIDALAQAVRYWLIRNPDAFCFQRPAKLQNQTTWFRTFEYGVQRLATALPKRMQLLSGTRPVLSVNKVMSGTRCR